MEPPRILGFRKYVFIDFTLPLRLGVFVDSLCLPPKL
jgi:hypothetical protein